VRNGINEIRKEKKRKEKQHGCHNLFKREILL
jgi:hypothetical protein